jgi:hypothetical protein
MRYLVMLLLGCAPDVDDYPTIPNPAPSVVAGVHVSTQPDAGVRADATNPPPLDARPDAPLPTDAE